MADSDIGRDGGIGRRAGLRIRGTSQPQYDAILAPSENSFFSILANRAEIVGYLQKVSTLFGGLRRTHKRYPFAIFYRRELRPCPHRCAVTWAEFPCVRCRVRQAAASAIRVILEDLFSGHYPIIRPLAARVKGNHFHTLSHKEIFCITKSKAPSEDGACAGL
jgi:hypothetical protein